MVAITVLLAATVATFFLGFEDSVTDDQQAPTVTFDDDYDASGASDELSIQPTGGKTLDRATIRVVFSDANCGGTTWSHRFTATGLGATTTRLTAGTELPVTETAVCDRTGTPSGDLDLSSARVTVTWVGQDNADSHELYTWTGPDA